MSADRREVGWREAYRWTLTDRGALRLYLCLGGRELELLLVDDAELPGRGARRPLDGAGAGAGRSRKWPRRVTRPRLAPRGA